MRFIKFLCSKLQNSQHNSIVFTELEILYQPGLIATLSKAWLNPQEIDSIIDKVCTSSGQTTQYPD